MQRLAWDPIEVEELREEVTRAQVATVMVGARTTHAERMTQGRVILLVTTHGEASKVTQRVSALEGELMGARRDWDVTEEKILSRVAIMAIWPNGNM
jgi:hypothetical protein